MDTVGCGVCGMPTSLICRICKSASYCSLECQAKDSALHKRVCEQLIRLLESNPRPEDEKKPEDISSTTYKLIFRFDKDGADSHSPQILWAPTQLKIEDDGTCASICDVSELLRLEVPEKMSEVASDEGSQEELERETEKDPAQNLEQNLEQESDHESDQESPEQGSERESEQESEEGSDGESEGVLRSFTHSRHGRKIQFWFFDDGENAEDNQGIYNLVDGGVDFPMWEETYPSRLQGSIIIMGVSNESDDTRITDYRDITLDDLRVALSYFLEDTYLFPVPNDDYEYNPFVICSQPDWFKGVKITNVGEMEFGNDQFKEVMLNKNHPNIDTHHDKSTVTELMGMPLLFRRCPLLVKPSPFHHTDPCINLAAIFMLLGTDTSFEFESWGRPKFPKYDNGYDPTFLVFRKDKQDITKQQVEALSVYCHQVVSRAMEEPEAGIWRQKEKQAVLDHYCSAERFSDFFESFKQKKLEQGDKSWVDAKPPDGMKPTGWKKDSDRGVKRKRVSSSSTSASEGVSLLNDRQQRALAHAKSSVDLAMSDDQDNQEDETGANGYLDKGADTEGSCGGLANGV
ncbi:hypothetical protein BDZ45DRAFT_804395 [Acephala macrosclerotiorum]|nr:hypothetical protein BDZ45DRAFT_804395 [Acephala macrosclerotiorum]